MATSGEKQWSRKQIQDDIEELKQLIELAESRDDVESRVALDMFRHLLAERMRVSGSVGAAE